ncbi:EamA family transporter RarD [Paenibacillus antri]|uniref:EamA family transporter RarD n=1 Tax=Paenibacillus antri TaxID=2582848 RepID=A0A5R9G996_9BACL|nr:EamA family transporter RarD [Paenibacillus antri]TLS52311.1 EamA family transporter RarD [Paenibacillus antri]
MKAGVGYAILAYISWGLLPLYWNLFKGMPSDVVLGHRVVWSFLFVLCLLAWSKRLKEWKWMFRSKRSLFSVVAASALISANWLLFIHAVNSGHVVEASLGYYINPLVSVVLAVFFLGERPKPLQWAAIALAAVGVALLTISFGKPPWIALALAVSFAFYGVVKKKSSADAASGLFGETLVVLPPALIYLLFAGGLDAPFRSVDAWPLLLAGVATTLPLLWFAQAAKRLPLSTVGLIQYVSPTITLAIGVLLFREPFTNGHAWSFALIWSALALYTVASLRSARPTRPSRPAPASTESGAN